MGFDFRQYQDHNHQLVSQYHLSSVYLAGMVGGTVQLAIACPVELVKIRLQTSVQVMIIIIIIITIIIIIMMPGVQRPLALPLPHHKTSRPPRPRHRPRASLGQGWSRLRGLCRALRGPARPHRGPRPGISQRPQLLLLNQSEALLL